MKMAPEAFLHQRVSFDEEERQNKQKPIAIRIGMPTGLIVRRYG
jgi:hypothetical protein